MKKYILPLFIITAVLFSACNEDLLDIPQKGVISIDSFYITDEDAESALVNLYANFITNVGGNDGIYVPYNIIFNYCADNVLAAGEFYGTTINSPVSTNFDLTRKAPWYINYTGDYTLLSIMPTWLSTTSSTVKAR